LYRSINFKKKVKVVGRVDYDPAEVKLLKKYKEEEKNPTTKSHLPVWMRIVMSLCK
jgi:hypothetical protein